MALIEKIKPTEFKMTYEPPPHFEFSNSIKDFWYHAVWTAKKLLRGEI
ncbi:MAG: aminoglycoside 6-adenylyltransferase [bacterium]|nr:aminoglycoside 6-adenylyltransferase [bacterium]